MTGRRVSAGLLRGLAWACGAGIFLTSSLAFVRPPLNVLWKLSIVVREYGHFAALALLLAVAGRLVLSRHRGEVSRQTLTGLLALSALLFATPLVRAIAASARLERDFARTPFASASASAFPAGSFGWRDVRAPFQERGSVPAPETLVYAIDARAGALRLDYYPPASVRPAPCVVVVHGGGWDGGDRTQLSALNGYLAARGYAVAAIDYRLAPEFRSPSPVEDVSRALAFLRAHADSLGIDSGRFVLLGRSAGGQIALHAAYALGDSGVRGVIAFYAPADMEFGYRIAGNPLLLDSRGLMERYLGGGCFDVPARCRDASPVVAATAGAPPTLLLHGRADPLVAFDHARRLESRLDALGVPAFVVDLPWATHGYDYAFQGPASRISLRFIGRFLAYVAG